MGLLLSMNEFWIRLSAIIQGADPATLLLLAAGLACLESIFPPLPSETVIVLCAFAGARVGVHPLAMVAVTTAGAFSSLFALYLLGRGPWKRGLRGFLAARLPRADDHVRRLFERHPDLMLVFGRLIPGTRGPVACLAGSYGVPRGRAALLLGLTCLAWYLIYVLVGYSAGASWDGVAASLPMAGLRAGLVMFGIGFLFMLFRKRIERG